MFCGMTFMFCVCGAGEARQADQLLVARISAVL
jgi:hypothetical protein